MHMYICAHALFHNMFGDLLFPGIPWPIPVLELRTYTALGSGSIPSRGNRDPTSHMAKNK